MKSNEQQSPVDEYFRQRESGIPVTYNPEDWSHLATMLDSAESPDTPALQAPPRKTRFRGGKGWWASGIWIVSVTSLFWIIWQTSGNSAAEPHQHIPATAETVADAPGGVVPVRENENKTFGHSGSLGERGASANKPAPAAAIEPIPKPESSGETGKVILPSPADSFSTHQAPFTPLDSISQEIKPEKKKKKHLFW